ncbi:MAG: hypothetical protein IPL86_16075 [Flavobacteriales bacterium]|nr:hypothetical protein [Flavobacteriales bacterium]
MYDAEGDEVTVSAPAKMAVCHDCEGEGCVLTASIRNHAYSQEEFAEAFYDDRDGDLEDGQSPAEQYFRHGGRYDVVCPTCKGRNVVLVLDREACDAELLASIDKRDKEEAEYNRVCAMERRMGA